MTRDEFQNQLNRLMSVYGDKAYPPERSMLLWKAVNGLSQTWMERTVDDLISSARYAPLLTEFGPFIALERERVHKLEKDRGYTHTPNGTADCEWCRDNGTYLCTLNGDRSAPYAFRCHCKRGAADPRRHIPQYKREHQEQGFLYYEVTWERGAS